MLSPLRTAASDGCASRVPERRLAERLEALLELDAGEGEGAEAKLYPHQSPRLRPTRPPLPLW